MAKKNVFDLSNTTAWVVLTPDGKEAGRVVVVHGRTGSVKLVSQSYIHTAPNGQRVEFRTATAAEPGNRRAAGYNKVAAAFSKAGFGPFSVGANSDPDSKLRELGYTVIQAV